MDDEELPVKHLIVDMPHPSDETCKHPGCVAYQKLLSCKAKLQKRWKGEIARRRCEISMLAAAGDRGLSQKELVAARDHLVVHLGDQVDPIRKSTADCRDAVHAHNAALGDKHPYPHKLGPCIKVTKAPRAELPAVHKESDHYVLKFICEYCNTE